MDLEEVRADPIFARMIRFPPYDALIEAQRHARAGPIGKLWLRLEGIETRARIVQENLVRFNEILQALLRLIKAWTAVACLV
ncbi:MAG: hypothetical protein R3C68_00100 [Myxococcota bacterium]